MNIEYNTDDGEEVAGEYKYHSKYYMTHILWIIFRVSKK